MLTVGSLFSGIGGFDLGLERAGFEIKWQVEIDPYCRRVLAKHWPGVTRYTDIRTIDWSSVSPVALLCGGFPCQDISRIGKRVGIYGEQSGLWVAYMRAIRALRLRYILVENVPDLLICGNMCRVLGDLAADGYDAEWEVLPAAAFGAIHIRERVFLVGVDSNTQGHGFSAFSSIRPERVFGPDAVYSRISKTSWWETEPRVVRMANGIPSRLDRISGLGNSVVPQIAEALGRMILQAEQC